MAISANDKCCGCGACASICPKAAIILSESEYCGFVFPTVDHEKCLDCNLCTKVCPELSFPNSAMPLITLAVKCKDHSDYMTCASGGAATLLSRYFISSGGVVYGCSLKNYNTIRHIRVDREEDLEKLKGSKYVQSDMGMVYSNVKNDLRSGLNVLFIGTPCQVGALKNYLQHSWDNLFTVDLVCHGVPSQAMLRNAVQIEMEKSRGLDENTTVNFRWKMEYGIQFGIQYGNHGKIIKSVPAHRDPYMTAFINRLSYRESCYQCIFARTERVGDVTIGDFWGLGKVNPSELDIKSGVSLLLVNTLKGKKLWESVKDNFIFEERMLEEAVGGNKPLQRPTERPYNRDKFTHIFNTKGIDRASFYCNSRYRFERTMVMKTIRRIPFLEQSCKKMVRVMKKLSK